MEIKSSVERREFERLAHEEAAGLTRVFRCRDPHFLNFFRTSFTADEAAEPMDGVRIEWSPDSSLPKVILSDFRINECAQYFYHMYESLLFEVEK